MLNQPNDSTINIKLFILDPLSVIIKLAILGNKQLGTKIHILNNIIYFNEPSIIQFLHRYISNSTKSDLHYLYNPIQIACSTFLERYKDDNPERMKQLFISAQNGLKRLIDTYKHSSFVNVCLNYYYSIIENYIDSEPNKNLYHKDTMTSLYTNEVIIELDKCWNKNRIKIILDLINFLSISDNCENNVKSLENIMDVIDIETQQIISKI
jgi:hypothetical protein